MDKERFSKDKTGQLSKMEHPIKDWAFIPDFMPPRWKIPYDMWRLIADAEIRLTKLDVKCSQLPNPELLLHPLQSREAMTSSQLEGTYVQPEDLLLFELDRDEGKSSQNTEFQDWREVSNYTQALKHGFEEVSHRGLSLGLIREMHAILMRGTWGEDASPGAFRMKQVKIGHTGRFIPPPPEHVDSLMTNLEEQIQVKSVADGLVHCFQIHYQFETIHPFEDGNGRVGRLLLALMIYKLLDHRMPWLYMSAFYERHKDEYIDNLFKVSSEGNWTEWIEFCLRGAIHQADDAILRCDLFDSLKRDFASRLEDIGRKNVRMLETVQGLFASAVLTVPYLARRYGVHYQTAKKDVERLIGAKILRELPRPRPKAYYCPEIFSIAYGQPEEIEEMVFRLRKDQDQSSS